MIPSNYMQSMLWAINHKSKSLIMVLESAKIFIIKNDLKKLLGMTNNKICFRHLPYEVMFLDSYFYLDEHKSPEGRIPCIFGLILCANGENEFSIQGQMFISESDGTTIKDDKELAFFIRINEKGISKIDGGFSKDDIENLKKIPSTIFKNIANFCCNFIDFLNNPEVNVIEVERTIEQNAKRIKRGKFPIPPITLIRITGKLNIYLNKLESSDHLNYPHRFWVRGHFRTLRNEDRYKEKTGTKIWILPYIKGEGILINKNYEVKKKKHTLLTG